jgi:hypothetical protein
LLTPSGAEELRQIVTNGPDLSKDGIVRWRCVDLAKQSSVRFCVREVNGTLVRLWLRNGTDLIGFYTDRCGRQHGQGATLRDAVAGINADCPAREGHGVMERCDIYFPGWAVSATRHPNLIRTVPRQASRCGACCRVYSLVACLRPRPAPAVFDQHYAALP